MVDVLLQPWSEEDLSLLQKLLGDPETPEQIARRHQRYLHLPETSHMLKIGIPPRTFKARINKYYD
jgi:hypothetical protein